MSNRALPFDNVRSEQFNSKYIHFVKTDRAWKSINMQSCYTKLYCILQFTLNIISHGVFKSKLTKDKANSVTAATEISLNYIHKMQTKTTLQKRAFDVHWSFQYFHCWLKKTSLFFNDSQELFSTTKNIHKPCYVGIGNKMPLQSLNNAHKCKIQ